MRFLGFILILSAAFGFAEPASFALNPVCVAAGIQTIRLNGITAYPGPAPYLSTRDFCKDEPATMPAPVRAAVVQLGGIHSRVAQYLGLSISQLLGEGAAVVLGGRKTGALDSKYALGAISLGVFPDWNGEPINESIYVHELGHLLSMKPNVHLPPILISLGSNPLMMETFADFIDLAVTGSVFEPSRDVPACAWKTRNVTRSQSYDSPKQFFETTYSKAAILSCCRWIAQRGWHTDHTRSLCEAVPKAFPETAGLPFVLDRSKVFDPRDYLSGNGYFDPHRIGIPFNSFLLDVRAELGLEPKAVFYDALTGAKSLADVLRKMRERVPAEKLAAWDALWKKHAMTKFEAMARDSAN